MHKAFYILAVTFLLLPVSAGVSIAAGALLEPWPLVGDGVFLVIIFVAVYIFWNHYPHGLVPGVRFSQVGGHPTWIQGAEYPRCPECSGAMPFIAQISNEDLDDEVALDVGRDLRLRSDDRSSGRHHPSPGGASLETGDTVCAMSAGRVVAIAEVDGPSLRPVRVLNT